MIKYEIIYEVKNGKNRTERKKIILEDENLVALYKQLEKSEINQILEIKEV